MRFLHDTFAMGGVVVGTAVTVLMLFLQNAGVIDLSNVVLAAVWWLFAWPFMGTALFVAFTATGNNMSPVWGFPLLIASMVANVVYFYFMGKLAGFIVVRLKRK